tara:strand:+ start:13636 stop:14244 length:609 start_codon:yes stop_codon:yes gene_type:complete
LLYTILKERLKKELPGTSAHKAFSPLRKYQVDETKYRESAVAIHLKFDLNDIELILIKRSAYNGAHSQQIAFPGGKKEKSDMNLEFTARRESQEEIGMPIKNGIYLGKLSPVSIPVSQFKVTPHIFSHRAFPQLVRNEREVEEIIKCRLSDIDTQKYKSYQNIKIKSGVLLKNVPGINLDGHFIWGATALMIHELNCILKKL